MKSFFRFSLLILLAALVLKSTPLFAEQSAAELQNLDQKLAVLEVKVNRLSSIQTQIIQKQTEIKDELNNLGIWIRRK